MNCHGSIVRRAPARHDPDDDDGAAGARRPPGLLDRALGADRLERVVRAAAGDVLHRGDGVHPVSGLDDVGRTERPGELELLRPRVDGDDPGRAGEPRSLDDVRADAAAAPHGHARALLNVSGVRDGAVAGEHRAPDERCRVERHIPADADGRGLGHDRMARERRDRVEVMEGRPVQAEAARPVGQRPLRRHPGSERAEVRAAAPTLARTRRRRGRARARRGRLSRGSRRPARPPRRCPRPRGRARAGSGSGRWPSTTCRSLWHTPQAAMRTSTSPAFGGARSTSRTSTGRPGSHSTAACVFMARA